MQKGQMNPESDDILQILERIDKLSRKPDNPGLAYQNLEIIHALIEALRQKIAPATSGH
jgi:hypothetical protein